MIIISDYRFECIVGIHPHERKQEQEVALDLEYEPTNKNEMVDYDAVLKFCEQFSKEKKFHLLEEFTEELLTILFEKFPIQYAKLRVKKLRALVPAQFVACQLEKRA